MVLIEMGPGFAAQTRDGRVVAGLRNETRKDMEETILSGQSGTHGAVNSCHAASRTVWKEFISKSAPRRGDVE